MKIQKKVFFKFQCSSLELNDAILNFTFTITKIHLFILTFTCRWHWWLISTQQFFYTSKTSATTFSTCCYCRVRQFTVGFCDFHELWSKHRAMTLRQRFSKDPLKVVRQLDAFPKVPEECQQSTRIGGTRKQILINYSFDILSYVLFTWYFNKTFPFCLLFQFQSSVEYW